MTAAEAAPAAVATVSVTGSVIETEMADGIATAIEIEIGIEIGIETATGIATETGVTEEREVLLAAATGETAAAADGEVAALEIYKSCRWIYIVIICMDALSHWVIIYTSYFNTQVAVMSSNVDEGIYSRKLFLLVYIPVSAICT